MSATPNCEKCKRPFHPPYGRDRPYRFCSNWRRGRPLPARARRTMRTCSWCGGNVTRSRTNFHSKRFFCNRFCMGEWQSEFMVRERSSRWRGGSKRLDGLGVGWSGIRRQAIKRAGGVCQRCKRNPSKDVHHLLPIRFFQKPKEAHFKTNLVALCRRCHAQEHRRLEAALPLLNLLRQESSPDATKSVAS